MLKLQYIIKITGNGRSSHSPQVIGHDLGQSHRRAELLTVCYSRTVQWSAVPHTTSSSSPEEKLFRDYRLIFILRFINNEVCHLKGSLVRVRAVGVAAVTRPGNGLVCAAPPRPPVSRCKQLCHYGLWRTQPIMAFLIT